MDILEYVNQLNAKAEKLNIERQKSLGAMQAAKETFDELAKEYEAKYGVAVTLQNIGAEYTKVKDETTKSAEKLAEQINYIESGAYKVTKAKAVSAVEGTPFADASFSTATTPKATTPPKAVAPTPTVGTRPIKPVATAPKPVAQPVVPDVPMPEDIEFAEEADTEDVEGTIDINNFVGGDFEDLQAVFQGAMDSMHEDELNSKFTM